MSCAWNIEAVANNRILFDLGGNLYMYATDRAKLRSRLARRETGSGPKYAAQTVSKGDRGELVVARVKHGGQWYLGDNYHPWELLAGDLKAKADVNLTALAPLAAGAEVPPGTLLYYSGRAGSELTPEGAQWLKKALASGSVLWAEAALGDPQFDAALKKTLADAGLELKPLADGDPVISGDFSQGHGYNVAKVDYSFALRTERVGQPLPLLYGIYDGPKQVGVYSPFDVMFSQTGCKAFGNRGYAAEDARAIAMNIALWALTQKK
jgi:hypothetical protein